MFSTPRRASFFAASSSYLSLAYTYVSRPNPDRMNTDVFDIRSERTFAQYSHVHLWRDSVGQEDLFFLLSSDAPNGHTHLQRSTEDGFSTARTSGAGVHGYAGVHRDKMTRLQVHYRMGSQVHCLNVLFRNFIIHRTRPGDEPLSLREVSGEVSFSHPPVFQLSDSDAGCNLSRIGWNVLGDSLFSRLTPDIDATVFHVHTITMVFHALTGPTYLPFHRVDLIAIRPSIEAEGIFGLLPRLLPPSTSKSTCSGLLPFMPGMTYRINILLPPIVPKRTSRLCSQPVFNRQINSRDLQDATLAGRGVPSASKYGHRFSSACFLRRLVHHTGQRALPGAAGASCPPHVCRGDPNLDAPRFVPNVLASHMRRNAFKLPDLGLSVMASLISTLYTWPRGCLTMRSGLPHRVLEAFGHSALSQDLERCALRDATRTMKQLPYQPNTPSNSASTPPNNPTSRFVWRSWRPSSHFSSLPIQMFLFSQLTSLPRCFSYEDDDFSNEAFALCVMIDSQAYRKPSPGLYAHPGGRAIALPVACLVSASTFRAPIDDTNKTLFALRPPGAPSFTVLAPSVHLADTGNFKGMKPTSLPNFHALACMYEYVLPNEKQNVDLMPRRTKIKHHHRVIPAPLVRLPCHLCWREGRGTGRGAYIRRTLFNFLAAWLVSDSRDSRLVDVKRSAQKVHLVHTSMHAYFTQNGGPCAVHEVGAKLDYTFKLHSTRVDWEGFARRLSFMHSHAVTCNALYPLGAYFNIALRA
ncbi:hypothetical protein C8R43DRAFT_1150887 [Mycena crocata]|nr:hypothetical protein C8R43DRAFT_1150887 [Mycena crocata]